MKKYTVEELVAIFEKHSDTIPAFTNEQRERALDNPVLKDYINDLKEMYKVYTENMTVALPFTRFKRFFIDGNRPDGEYWYYYNRRKLHTVALMAWLFDEKEYYDELENILWAIMDEYVWNILAHVGPTGLTELQQDDFVIDLFSSETCQSIAEILAMVGDKLEPIITKRALRMIDERCFDVLHKPFFWKKRKQSWASTCASNVGMTALYVKKDPAELAKIIHSCLDTLEYYRAGRSDDGTYTEGLGYWSGAFGRYVFFGEMLRNRTNGEVDLFDDEKVKLIAQFPFKCLFKGGKVTTFSDCGASDSIKFDLSFYTKLKELIPEVIIPGKEFCTTAYPKGGCPPFSSTLRQIIWAPEELNISEFKPGTYILPIAQYYISSADNGIGLAAKAGYNWDLIEHHNHNDVGNIIVYKNGANLISDIGGGVYSASYFDENVRYDNFACSSLGHNVPIIDGKAQGYGESCCASGTVITEKDGLTADISAAYENENLESLIRSVILDKDEARVYLKDSYKFKSKPTSVVERFVSYNEIKLENGVVTISSNGEMLTFGYDNSMLKPILRVYDDVENKVRHKSGFKVYIVDFELIVPKEEFTLELTME